METITLAQFVSQLAGRRKDTAYRLGKLRRKNNPRAIVRQMTRLREHMQEHPGAVPEAQADLKELRCVARTLAEADTADALAASLARLVGFMHRTRDRRPEYRSTRTATKKCMAIYGMRAVELALAAADAPAPSA